MTRKTQRTNLILIGVFVVLGAFALGKMFFVHASEETGETAQASENVFPGLKKDDISVVAIDGPEGKKVELKRDGDHWAVASEGDARADQGDVDRVLKGVTDLPKGRVVSSTGTNLAGYSLDEKKAIHVRAWGKEGKSGKVVADFSIGKSADDYRSSFVQIGDKKEVRKITGTDAPNASSFEPGYDNTWRDKSVYDNGPADKIEQIEITDAKGTTIALREKVMAEKEQKPEEDPAAKAGADSKKPELEVKETRWNLTAPITGRAKKWQIDSIANSLAKLECDSFFDGKETPAELGLDPPAITLKARREGETEPKVILLVGNKSKDNKYPVKKPDAPTVWWIAGFRGDYFTKTPEELLETPPKSPEDAKKDDAKKDEAAGEKKDDGSAEKKDEGKQEDGAEGKKDDGAHGEKDDGVHKSDGSSPPPPVKPGGNG